MNRHTKFKIATIAVAWAAVTIGSGMTNPAAARHCLGNSVTGKKASAVKLSKAKQRARSKWTSKAKSAFGTRGDSWSSARHKGYSCAKAGIWYCRASAMPCTSTATSSGGSQKPIN